MTSSDAADRHFDGNGWSAGVLIRKGEKGLDRDHGGAVVPDTHRFNFSVNGVKRPDPHSMMFSTDPMGVNSMLEVVGEAGKFQAWDRTCHMVR